MILLIDNYDSFTFNLVHLLGEVGGTCLVRRNDAIDVAGALALAPEAIVLSPGPCTPGQAGICLELIAAAAGRVPVLAGVVAPTTDRVAAHAVAARPAGVAGVVGTAPLDAL